MPLDLPHVLEALIEGIIVCDEWGVVRQVNASACRILEDSTETFVGKPIEEVHGADHAIARLARAVLESARAATTSDERVERRLEADVVVDVSASPIFDAEGNVDGVVVSLRDRTVRLALEEDAAERERLDLFGRIAMGLAHEVKNPLGGIRGAGEILAARASDARNRDAAELIVREVDRIAGLVEDFMVLARGEELRWGQLSVHRVLDDVLAVLEHDPVAEGATVKRVFDPSIPDLPGDASRLVQVFLNLARNAFEAMQDQPGERLLRVTTRMSLSNRLSTAEGTPVPTVAIELQDSGPGFAEESIDKAATPFFTTRKQGTGLGLPLADHWVTRHGGRMRFENAPGGGAVVRVYLPLRRLE